MRISKHDPQCDGLSENWRGLLKEGPSDQSIPLRCSNGITHLIRPAGEALRLKVAVLCVLHVMCDVVVCVSCFILLSTTKVFRF